MIQDLLKSLDDLRLKVDAAWRILKLDDVRFQIDALQVAQTKEGYWQDIDKATKQSQQLSDLQRVYAAWSNMRVSLVEMDELIRLSVDDNDSSMNDDIKTRLAELESTYAAREFDLLFSGPHDDKNAIVAIHAGAGGTDAQDWAEMLLRMYFRYAERNQWKLQLVDESRGTEAGIKSATFIVSGDHVYGHLRAEAGVHRLVRQSPFNADALRQTSFALVEVLPEFDASVDIDIRAEDLRIDTFMSGGKGGQSVNTTYSAVRIVHLPTKITVSCQNERSQTQNKETAMRILKARLMQLQEQERQKEKQELRGEYQSAEWGNQIRSYVLHPYKMVKDHRTSVETSDPDDVLDGHLDRFVEGYLRQHAATG